MCDGISRLLTNQTSGNVILASNDRVGCCTHVAEPNYLDVGSKNFKSARDAKHGQKYRANDVRILHHSGSCSIGYNPSEYYWSRRAKPFEKKNRRLGGYLGDVEVYKHGIRRWSRTTPKIMFPSVVCTVSLIILASSSRIAAVGPTSTQIQNLVTFGDSYTAVVSAHNAFATNVTAHRQLYR